MAVMETTVNRTYKASMFEMVFSSKKELFEHQSTCSPNLPLRFLFYASDLYSAMVKDVNLYGTKQVKIPAPKFVIFYNGADECPDRQEMRLSTAFCVEERKLSLELKATLLNINPGHNKKLLKACKTLRDYSEYVARVRRYAKSMDIGEAVERAINECIREGILAEFLKRNRAEAMKMSIYEYDEVRHMRQTREEGYEDGYHNGYDTGCAEGRDQINLLITKLHKAGRVADIIKAATDKAYQRSLFEEFGL